MGEEGCEVVKEVSVSEASLVTKLRMFGGRRSLPGVDSSRREHQYSLCVLRPGALDGGLALGASAFVGQGFVYGSHCGEGVLDLSRCWRESDRGFREGLEKELLDVNFFFIGRWGPCVGNFQVGANQRGQMGG